MAVRYLTFGDFAIVFMGFCFHLWINIDKQLFATSI